jgi:hypothetical protein
MGISTDGRGPARFNTDEIQKREERGSMCPACAAMIAMVTAGVASTGALGVVLAGMRRSKIDMPTGVDGYADGVQIAATQKESKERSHDDNQCN